MRFQSLKCGQLECFFGCSAENFASVRADVRDGRMKSKVHARDRAASS